MTGGFFNHYDDRFCADTYEAEDAAGKHRIDNVW